MSRNIIVIQFDCIGTWYDMQTNFKKTLHSTQERRKFQAVIQIQTKTALCS